MEQELYKRFAAAEEAVIKDVLRQILKREPVPEDAKDLTIFYERGVLNKYHLTYKNMKLGTVKMLTGFENQRFGFEFIPFKEDELF